MATIKPYIKNNRTHYMFKLYLGTDSSGKKRFTTRRGFKTIREAKTELSRIELEYRDRKPTTIMSLEQVYNVWLPTYENTVKPSTLNKTKEIFRLHILPKLGRLKVNKITPMMLQEQMNEWAEQFKTGSKIMNYVGLVMDCAVRNGMITHNPVTSIKKPRKKQTIRRDNFLDVNELKVFMESASHSQSQHAYVFFRVLAFTGMRKGEVLGLMWEDVDLDNSIINVRRSVSRDENGLYIDTPKTKTSVRRITLDDTTVSILKEYQLTTLDKGLVFKSENGTVLAPLKPNRWLANILNKTTINKKITVHGFRHTHASLLFESGASLKEVQYRLGHSNSQTTMDVYTHVTKTAKDNLGDKFNSYVNF